ncbi:alpha/beta hydrolase-fold protein [Tenacibaculum sp. M341]|uniref:alpha/beta hydrolase-fold protein n=1 Tax=Tenacibaculum sp. M341 TaxID=2530339 RepID=UPI001043E801|nr:alpha/beta hydrolase-fold protein [Tenacibaculum sp. M341]TCI84870.1 alpha/beta hydrolase [Tenacibaculum sp. M341]
MKKTGLITFLFFCFLCINGQKSDDIVIGKIDGLHSKILNEQRKIFVHVPKTNPNNKEIFPVVYVLDGNAHFDSVVALLKQFSTVNGNTLCPKMIVIGIPNTFRSRDLSPTKGEIVGSGGGDQFMSFIEKELIPYVDSKYPTQPYRMFIGHSLGGLTVMNALLKKPELFNSYVAIDPSMFWNEKNLLKKIRQTEFGNRYTNKTLFLGYANIKNSDSSNAIKHSKAILELKDYLENGSNTKLSFKATYYPNDDHGSMPLITTYDALRFIFSFYDFKLTNNDYLNPEINILNKIENYYRALSKGFDTKMIPDEKFVSDIGYELLRKGQLKRALQLFQWNLKNYPSSSYSYESLGDYYDKTNDKVKALKHYKKALSLKYNPYIEDQIKKLEEK